jgi:hypothetical protein
MQGGMLTFERDWEEEPYWFVNRFWKKFIADSSFDHAYFLDIFKVIVGDCSFRKKILRNALNQRGPLIFNSYTSEDSEKVRYGNIAKCVANAKRLQQKAYLTWEYPPITDAKGHMESHCVMYIFDPMENKVISVDSRGTRFARAFSKQWDKAYKLMRNLFSDCQWIDAVSNDMQILNWNDHFCQTWSLILTIAIENSQHAEKDNGKRMDDSAMSDTSTESITDPNNFLYFGPAAQELSFDVESIMTGFGSIIQFWKDLVSDDSFKQAIYYEIYRHTHTTDGEHIYDRYFTTLEALVNCSNSVYYPHNVHYKFTRYTFIEDFVFELNEATLRRILE